MNLKASPLAAALLGLAALAPHARAQEPPPAPPAPAARVADPAALSELLAAVEGPRKNDADAWHQLGIEYNLAGDTGKARVAFQQAVKLRSNFHAARAGLAYTYFAEGKLDEAAPIAERAAEAEVKEAMRRRGGPRPDFVAARVHSAIQMRQFYDLCAAALAQAEKALAEGSTDARAHLLKARALIGLSVGPQRIAPDLGLPPPPGEAEREATAANRKLLAEAAVHLAEHLRLSPGDRGREELAAQLESVRHYAGLSADGSPPLRQSEVSSKAVIVSKPEPGFTERARKNNVEGMVRLRAVLAADGAVRHILVLKPLPDGLTEKAVEAARRIRFRPAVKDGRPVNVVVQVEYNFNIY